MASGKRYKFQGSSISVVVGFAADSPSKAISGATRANPCVVSSSNHGLSNGDVVRITGVVGMDELNNELFVVANKQTSSFELEGVDSTGYGQYTSGGLIDVAEFSEFCELTNYNRTGGSSPEIQATTICSDAAEYELGLPDFGTTQISFNFAPQTAVQTALHDFYLSGEKIAVKVELPSSAGTMIQMGFIQQESETVGTGGLWAATVTIRNTGNRFDIV